MLRVPRLLHTCQEKMVSRLQSLGYKVEVLGDTILVYTNTETKDLLCSYEWIRGNPTEPNKWLFRMAAQEAFSELDFEITLQRVENFVNGRSILRSAWAEYLLTKSNRRWKEYKDALYAYLRNYERW